MKLVDCCKINVDSYSSKDKWPVIRYLDTGNLTEGRIDEIQTLIPGKDKIPSRAKRKVKAGDILFSTVRPNQRHYGIVGADTENLLVSTGFAVITTDDNIADFRFIYYFLTQNDIVEALHVIAEQSVSAYPSIKPSDIEGIDIPLPELETQRKIAAILSALDDKIELNRRINENLCATIDAFYLSLFDSEIEDATIGDYAQKIYSGGTPNTSNLSFWNGNLGWFSSGETRNRFVINTEKTITQAGVDNSSTKLARKYDIVIASAGQGFTRGQTSMLLLDTYVNQSVIVIHTDRRMSPYLFWSLGKRYNELRAVSDSNSIRGSLTTKMIAAFKIPKGNDKRLEKFSNYTWPIIAKIENNLCENNKLIAMRDALLPRLMSGEIDVDDVKF